MEYKIGKNAALVRLDKGEDVVESLKRFYPVCGYPTALVSGLGAVNEIETGLFLTREKRYVSTVRKGDMEIVSLVGTVGKMNGETYAHLHLSAADCEGAVFGGHLNRAIVSATAELVVQRVEPAADRTFSDEIGLNLWDFRKKTTL